MSLLSPQDALELQAMVDAVPSNPSECIGPLQLAAKAGVPVHRVEHLLRQHPRYFVNVGGRNLYSLSRLAVHRGSRAKIVAEIDASLRESVRSSQLRVLMPITALAAAAGAPIAYLFGHQQWVAGFVVAIVPSVAFLCVGIGALARRRRSR